MKRWKKLLAVTLMVAMVCGVFAVIEPEKAEAAMPTTVYFNETFDTKGTFDNATWKSNSNANLGKWKEYVSDGKMTVVETSSTVYLTADDDIISDKSDYTVSCEVQYDTKPTTQANVGLVARISAESNATMTNTGYEFQLTIPAEDDESPYVRIRDRADNGGYYTGIVRLDDLEYVQEPVLMEIECRGSNIICSVNNEVVLTYTISETGRYAGYNPETDGEQYTHVYNVGPAGIRFARSAANAENGIGANVSVDNFKVHYVADHKFSDDFNGYDGDATNTEKQDALEANGWWILDWRNAGLVDGSAYVIPGESAVQRIVLQTEKAKGALGWNDYSVEADVTIGTSADNVPLDDVYACVTGRHTVTQGKDGYEIRLYVDVQKNAETSETTYVQKLQIYERGGGGVLNSCEFPIVYGQTYNLKAVFQENTIHAYVDGELYISAIDDSYPIGFAGFSKIGVTNSPCGIDVKFDNFVVYDYDVAPSRFKENFDSYIASGTDATNQLAMRENGWNALTQWTGNLNTGTNMKIPYNRELNLKTSKVAGAAEWKNCIVECDFDFTRIDDTTTITSQRDMYIACRETSDDTGYGFCVQTSKANQIWKVFLVKNGAKINEVEAYVDISGGSRIDFGSMLTARLEVNERTVIGYIVGYESITTCTYTIPETEEITGGYAGVHTDRASTLMNEVVIDNFKVYDLDYVKEIVGDLDGNRVVNNADAEVLKGSLLEGTLEEEALNVDKKNAVNIYDYVRMKRLLDSMN